MSAEAVEFPIQPNLGAGIKLFLHSQLFVTPQFPSQSFAGRTVIVTGSNVGLGFEAARHFFRLDCAKLILAVRDVRKGETAKEDIVASIKHRKDPESIEVWALDMSITDSTLAFAERIKSELDRIDVLVENAGVNSPKRFESEGFEQTMQVNILNTTLLALLLLPKLADTKARFSDASPHVVVVSSEAHRLTGFKAINAPDIYEKLNEKHGYNGQDRYEVSKLLEILIFREIASRLQSKQAGSPPVVVSTVNPGLCKSTLASRNESTGIGLRLMFFLLGRTTEVGARTLVLAASAGAEAHGEYMSDGKTQEVESWIRTDMGQRVQKKAFEQTIKILETRKPGVLAAAGI